MKNIILFVLVNLVFIASVYSQTRQRYILDNFEIKGVQVVVTQADLSTSSQSDKNKLVKKTSQTTVVAGNESSLKNTSSATVKLVNKTVMSANKNLSGYSTGDSTIDSYIVESSARYGIDPLLIYAQMNQESGFKLRATSNKGASGLMQLMPATAVRFGVRDIYDAKQNIDAGVKYMRWLINKFNGDINLALAGYNAGEGAVMKYGNQIPPYTETQNYVKKISARYNSIKKVSPEKTVNKASQQFVAKSEKQVPSVSGNGNSLRIGMSNGKTGLVNR
jgi:soluble lytic murein transglycosylase-like protein